ncbi:hypothetical protein FLM52_09245 [bacterium Scap17]|nr:hypothetical protein [bacterium Scap17]
MSLPTSSEKEKGRQLELGAGNVTIGKGQQRSRLIQASGWGSAAQILPLGLFATIGIEFGDTVIACNSHSMSQISSVPQ